MTGDPYAQLQSDIESLNQQDLVVISQIDYYESYINDIRVIDSTHIEVDSCEVWTNDTYNRSSGDLVASDGPSLVPQTITIQQVNSDWMITDIQFFDAPAFCTQ